ncbi:MAG: LysM peptidoglycan-binding domain-containing protein [candidate division KSB1 bacterium]|nr:LysM peptidoglycan-binding domain-containing protein [candidate division KSB1 bacterium]
MKALLKGLLLSVLLASFWIHGETLWSSRLFLNEPRIHVIREGEYLSKIAQQYYGKASYWRALALLNRAPDPNKIYPGERIMLPEATAVAKIARARRLSEVNEIAFEQEQMAKIETEEELTEFRNRQKGGFHQAAAGDELAEPEPEIKKVLESPAEPGETLSLPESELPEPATQDEDRAEIQAALPGQTETGGRNWLWPAIIVAMLVFGSGYVFVRRRREAFEDEPVDETGEAVWEAVDKHKDGAAKTGRAGSEKKDEALLLQ